MADASMIRVPYETVLDTLQMILRAQGMRGDRAKLCAQLFAAASRDGVYSHGLDRFPGFIRSIKNGVVNAAAEPTNVFAAGPLERWDGQLGPGPLNAHFSMGRAIELAREHGIGCVGLCRTNHWMRAGNYGWQAADARMIGICWTNTNALMPPWGAQDRRVGNNPIVFAVPRSGGHLVLDMALSQFSFGKLGTLIRLGLPTPVMGGFDAEGKPTMDPSAIMKGGRMLPIGCWKGTGLAMMLDVIAAAISGGKTTAQITAQGGEKAVSQVYIAIDTKPLGGVDAVSALADVVVADVQSAKPITDGERVLYPGQRAMETRRESEREGIAVAASVWETILGEARNPNHLRMKKPEA